LLLLHESSADHLVDRSTPRDVYFAILPAAATGLLIDAILAFMGDRARHGVGFYAVAFALPTLFFATYEVAAIAAGQAGRQTCCSAPQSSPDSLVCS
jgi:hypothetical protein